MNGLTIIMLCFGFLILLAGFVLYRGKKDELLLWKVYDINKISTEEVKNIGFWTMISSIIPFIIALISLFIEV